VSQSRGAYGAPRRAASSSTLRDRAGLCRLRRSTVSANTAAGGDASGRFCVTIDRSPGPTRHLLSPGSATIRPRSGRPWPIEPTNPQTWRSPMPSRSPGTHEWLISTPQSRNIDLRNSEALTHRRQRVAQRGRCPTRHQQTEHRPRRPLATQFPPRHRGRSAPDARPLDRLRQLPTVGPTEYGGIEYGG
jgi:hypothetical protein